MAAEQTNVDLMSPEGVADYFGVTRRTVYTWIKDNKLPAIRIGKTIRVLRSDVQSAGSRTAAAANGN